VNEQGNAPSRLEITVAETFLPTDLGVEDARKLGVRFDYRFSPGLRRSGYANRMAAPWAPDKHG
jgi:hypothetical protein